MKIDIFKKIKKESYLARGEQAIKFVKNNLERPDSWVFDDELRLRSYYMLISFGFELILKSRVIALSSALDEPSLDRELKNIGHDFINLFGVLREEKLKRIGLKKDIVRKAHKRDYNYFIIKTIDDRVIKIEDFNNLRYGGNHPCPDKNEYRKIIEYTEQILEISKKIRNANAD